MRSLYGSRSGAACVVDVEEQAHRRGDLAKMETTLAGTVFGRCVKKNGDESLRPVPPMYVEISISSL